MNEQTKVRLKKLEQIKALGINPYPYNFDQSHTIEALFEDSDDLLEKKTLVSIAGRLISIRGQGKTSFAHILVKHKSFQIYVRRDVVGDKSFELFRLLDHGDHIGLNGKLMKTKTGELTLRVASLELLSKSIRAMPAHKAKEVENERIVFDEISDKEFRYRQRYVDLNLNQYVSDIFKNRAKIIQGIRSYLINKNFLEVETPTLQTIYGGAHASPFVTNHNALGVDFYLRISNELFLKRLIVGGFERVFEIVKDFRNEGIDRTHNPEFSVVEFYQAYSDYTDMIEHLQNIYESACILVHGTTEIEFQNKTLSFKKPWNKSTMNEAIKKYADIEITEMDENQIKNFLSEKELTLDGEFSKGRAILLIFEEFCEPKLIQPTIITEYPKESTPLCKQHRDNPDNIERFEAFVNGWEVANAYSELNDPVKQKKLLSEQEQRGRAGEDETHPMDHDFIRAIEYGMPPLGGIGLGIDRMVMLLTNQNNIRDVILFPTLRPETF